MAEWLTGAESVIGLGIALVGVTITVLAHRRRVTPRLKIGSLTEFSDDQYIQISVVNTGGRPVTIVSVGLVRLPRKESPIPWVRARERSRTSRDSAALGDNSEGQDDARTLGPTERIIVRISMSRVSHLPKDQIAWPWAEDSAGRDYYAAEAASIQRIGGDVDDA